MPASVRPPETPSALVELSAMAAHLPKVAAAKSPNRFSPRALISMASRGFRLAGTPLFVVHLEYAFAAVHGQGFGLPRLAGVSSMGRHGNV